MCMLANREEPDEMLYNQSSENEIQNYLEILTPWYIQWTIPSLLYGPQRLSSGGLWTTQAQTSLHICTVWSTPLLFTFWKVLYVNLLQAKLNSLASLFSRGDWFESHFGRKPWRQVFSCWGPYHTKRKNPLVHKGLNFNECWWEPHLCGSGTTLVPNNAIKFWKSYMHSSLIRTYTVSCWMWNVWLTEAPTVLFCTVYMVKPIKQAEHVLIQHLFHQHKAPVFRSQTILHGETKRVCRACAYRGHTGKYE